MLPYHVLTQPHVLTIAPPPELRYLFPLRPLDSELLLYLNPLYLSIQTNLIIAFNFVHLRLLAFLPLKSPPTNSLLSDLWPTPASDLRPKIIGHTH